MNKDAAALATICAAQEVRHLIVGLPLELDGTEERSARLALHIRAALSAHTALKPVYIDERFTSVEATERLIEQNVSRARRKQIIDQEAAVIILQSWLDHGDWSRIDA
ncbi:MAG: Holliday junction resolvase RuvX [Sandaracinaceae bacterium]|nr:Holliday junction resolvase RuvX [Sandaracinaceae bacterium]